MEPSAGGVADPVLLYHSVSTLVLRLKKNSEGLLAVIAHNFIGAGNISNMLRYLYGRKHM